MDGMILHEQKPVLKEIEIQGYISSYNCDNVVRFIDIRR